ncbi:hypothetical protein ACTQ3U_10410 [Oscillospiraceae bacterium LCP25S3_F9]
MNLAKGIVEIEGERFCPGYTFENFKKSIFYRHQTDISIFALNKAQNPIVLDNHCFVITVLFRDSKLRLLSLYCIDEDISYEQEELRKKLHKKVLKEQGLSNINVFSWGIVKLEYDPRISRYSIDVIYNP